MSAKTATSSALLGLALAGASASAAIATDLQGYYKLDETSNAPGTTVANSGTIAENGSIVEVVAVGQAGVVGNSYNFDGGGTANDGGANARVNLGTQVIDNLTVRQNADRSDLSPPDATGTNTGTFAAWVNPSFLRPGTNAASRSNIISSNTDIQFVVYRGGTDQAAGDLLFNWTNSTGTNIDVNSIGNAAGLRVPVGQWSHVVATRAAETMRLYINGVMVGEELGEAGNFHQRLTVDTSGDGVADIVELNAATTSITNLRDYSGLMDEVGVWVGDALEQKEIAAVAGLARLAGVGLDSTGIDDVIAVFDATGGSAVAGGKTWEYTTNFATPADASTLLLGKHYNDADGNSYIIMGGSPGAFTGVMAAVPEPGSVGALVAVATLLGLKRRRRA